MNSSYPIATFTTEFFFINNRIQIILALVGKCETDETWELDYSKFHEISSLKNSKADGYLFKLNFFVYGQKEVHILLSATEKPNIEKESAYEIGKEIFWFYLFRILTMY